MSCRSCRWSRTGWARASTWPGGGRNGPPASWGFRPSSTERPIRRGGRCRRCGGRRSGGGGRTSGRTSRIRRRGRRRWGPGRGRRRSTGGWGPAAAQAAALPLRQAAPDAELLMVTERVLQALEADGAAGTDGLGLPGGGPALGEEQLGVDAQTVGPLLPATLLLGHSPKQLVHGALQGETRWCNYTRVTMP